MKKIITFIAIAFAFLMTACMQHGQVCNTYTDNSVPVIEKSIQDI